LSFWTISAGMFFGAPSPNHPLHSHARNRQPSGYRAMPPNALPSQQRGFSSRSRGRHVRAASATSGGRALWRLSN
jgi:hypothetical protein